MSADATDEQVDGAQRFNGPRVKIYLPRERRRLLGRIRRWMRPRAGDPFNAFLMMTSQRAHGRADGSWTEEDEARYQGMLEWKLHGPHVVLAHAVADDWGGFLLHIPKCYRLEAVLFAEQYMVDVCYWEAVRSAWTDSENVWQYHEEGLLPLVLLAPRRVASRNAHFMNDDERRELATMPDPLVIYRGAMGGLNEEGWSWTTDEDAAVWFAARFADEWGRAPVLLRAEVRKSSVIGFIQERNESEIIIRPEDVHGRAEQVDVPVDALRDRAKAVRDRLMAAN